MFFAARTPIRWTRTSDMAIGQLPKRRVVITGVGVVSPLGNSTADVWDALANGRSAIDTIRSVPVDGLPIRIAAEARQFATDDIDSFGPLEKDRKKAIRKALKMMSRECQMGLAAGQLALGDARLDAQAVAPERIGVEYNADFMITMPDDFTDSIAACLDESGRFVFDRWAADGMPRMNPLWLLRYLPNMPAAHLAIYNDLRGPNNSLTLREAGGNAALVEAFHVIQRGAADAMVVGATGSRLNPLQFVHSIQQEQLSDLNDSPAESIRPFDLNRRGTVLGEGAAAVVLEDEEIARKRGAVIYGELLGGAVVASTGAQMRADRRKGLQNAMALALQRCQLTPAAIGHVNAHGLGTQLCDQEEAQAINGVFSAANRDVPVVAVKSYCGSLGAAGGLVEIVASLLALKNNRLFRVLNYQTPDPNCPVHPVVDEGVPPGDCFININVTPQGLSSAAVIRRAE